MTKAFRFYETGGPEVLRWEDVEVGSPGPGQVRMRHTAVAVNFRDILIRNGLHKVATLPSGLGLEAAGVVEALGRMSRILRSEIVWSASPVRTALMRRPGLSRRSVS